MLCGRSQRIRSPRWLVAAALSAAVTSTKPQETAPNSQAEPSQKKSTPPNANRSSGERGLGGEALLSEKRPLPQNLLVRPPHSPVVLTFVLWYTEEGMEGFMKDVFLIVDGNSLMHRAFHALPLMGFGGTYTNAIHGFLTMLLKVVKGRECPLLRRML